MKLRRAILQITPEAMVDILSVVLDYEQAPVTFRITKHGVPRSARLCGMFTDYSRGVIALTLEDPSFAEVDEGALLPILPSPEISVVRSP